MTDLNADYEINSLISHASQLHSPPEVAQKLLNLTRHDDYSIRDVVECIQRDPAMSAKMLRLVNSSRYGLRSKVTNLNQTVALLGRRTVRLLALTFSIVDTLAGGSARAIYNTYWRDALTMACGAARLARHLEDVDPDDAYAAGLLADVGSLVMAQVRGERYLSIYGAHRGAALCTAEQTSYGFDHTDVGACMLEQWQFSAEILDAVRHHHDQSGPRPMAVATHGGALLAETIWSDDTENVNDFRDWFHSTFGIRAEEFSDLTQQCRREVTLELDIYGIGCVQDADCESLIEEARRQILSTSLDSAIDLDAVECALNGCR